MELTEDLLSRMECAAREAAGRSYCPYSNFAVGAAVLTSEGSVFSGCNVENASFGLCICAERVAVFQAVSAGEREIVAVVLYTPTERPVVPCGACLQVLAEFGRKAALVSICDGNVRIETSLDLLLPKAFGLSELRGAGLEKE